MSQVFQEISYYHYNFCDQPFVLEEVLPYTMNLTRQVEQRQSPLHYGKILTRSQEYTSSYRSSKSNPRRAKYDVKKLLPLIDQKSTKSKLTHEESLEISLPKLDPSQDHQESVYLQSYRNSDSIYKMEQREHSPYLQNQIQFFKHTNKNPTHYKKRFTFKPATRPKNRSVQIKSTRLSPYLK